MLFQGGALFDSLKVWENVAFGLMQGIAGRWPAARPGMLRSTNWVRSVCGEDVGELFPVELSGGMQKRVGLARAIATEPDIIFFDEPTTGLDPIMADVINDLIVKCTKELGATTTRSPRDSASWKIWTGSP